MVRDAAKELPEVFAPADVIQKVLERYPGVNPSTIRCQVIATSPNHPSSKHYSTPSKLFYYLGEGRFRFLTNDEEKAVGEQSASDECVEDDNIASTEFSFEFERDLETHLANNLSDIENGLKIYSTNDGRPGRQFDTDAGRIDLLLLDKNDDFVVVEVKADQATHNACSQLQGYMGWVKRHLAGDRKVRGIIICRQSTDRLRYAVIAAENVTVKEYEVDFTLHDADLENL